MLAPVRSLGKLVFPFFIVIFGQGCGDGPIFDGSEASAPAPRRGRLGQVCPRVFTLFGLDFESSQTDSDLAFLS